jgi:hypothetical protein
MKNILKKLAVLLLVGLPMLSGCYDFEFPELDLSGGGYYYGPYDGGGYGGGYPAFTLSEMNMDSAALINDSTMLFWASLHFNQDTLLYVQNYDLIWYELEETSPGIWASVWPVGKIKTWNVSDTVNFATSNQEPFIISFMLPMDSLKANTFYAFNPGGLYTTPDAKSGALTGKALLKWTP